MYLFVSKVKSSLFTIISISLIPSTSFLVSSSKWSLRITSLIVNYWTSDFKIFKASTCFIP